MSNKKKFGFPDGTLVLTDKGYQEIETISAGCFVMTHRGRFRKVLSTESCESETVLLSGNSTLESAKDNYILGAAISKNDKSSDIKEDWFWTPDIMNNYWTIQHNIIDIPASIVTDFCTTKLPNVMTQPEFWRLVGIQITFNSVHDEIQKSTLYSDTKGFMTWLHKAVGTRSRQRCIPTFFMTLCKDFKQAFLDGFMAYNGGVEPKSNCYRYQTSNKKFIYGLRFIAESLGYNTHVCYLDRPETTVMFGRVVNQKPRYTLSISCSQERYRGIQNIIHTFYKCTSIKPTEVIKTVYSLSVEEDNSFIADSIVVRGNE